MKPYFCSTDARLFLGDCQDVLPQLPRRSIDVVVTDPPWNLGMDYGAHNDDMAIDDYVAWLAGVVAACAQTGARRLIYLPGRHHLWRVTTVLAGSGFAVSGVLRWQRSGAPDDWEPVVVADQSGVAPSGSDGPTTFRAARPQADGASGHPCRKPAALMEWLLDRYAGATATVLDPFAGVGTTLVAARAVGLRSVGIELEQRYCAAAAVQLRQRAS